MSLVTLAEALAHCRMPAAETLLAEDVADLTLKLATAEEWVLAFVAVQLGTEGAAWKATVAAWDASSAPRVVLQAIEVQFMELHRFRGDEDRAARQERAPCLEARNLLAHLRDPVFG